jgi:hypothetical protein
VSGKRASPHSKTQRRQETPRQKPTERLVVLVHLLLCVVAHPLHPLDAPHNQSAVSNQQRTPERMDVHEEMYYAATTSSSSISRRIVEADDETDSLYDQALRSRPQQEHHYGDLLPVAGEGYDFFDNNKNNWGIAVGIFCIGLFQFYGTHRWQQACDRLFAPFGLWLVVCAFVSSI